MRSLIAVSFLTSIATAQAGCPSPTIVTTPEAPPDALRGAAALERSVIGDWVGTAQDGSDTPVGVTLTLEDDYDYSIEAGEVVMSDVWRVEGDLVVLDKDPDNFTVDGAICFRASRIDAARIEGRWAYADPDGTCSDDWYAVTLNRRVDQGWPTPAPGGQR